MKYVDEGLWNILLAAVLFVIASVCGKRAVAHAVKASTIDLFVVVLKMTSRHSVEQSHRLQSEGGLYQPLIRGHHFHYSVHVSCEFLIFEFAYKIRTTYFMRTDKKKAVLGDFRAKMWE
jgi:hypothetical protein